jgi:mono/diheme cytochrome c family protein
MSNSAASTSRFPLRLALVLIASAFIIASIVKLYEAQPPLATLPSTQQIEHGRQLVTLGGCNDCHTPVKFDPKLGLPVPQVERVLSGHPQGSPGPASTLADSDQAVLGPHRRFLRNGVRREPDARSRDGLG